jgi:hypothetical protein
MTFSDREEVAPSKMFFQRKHYVLTMNAMIIFVTYVYLVHI